jgi:hypothetical protein
MAEHVSIRPVAAGEAARCVELGLAAFDGQSKDQLLERRFGITPNGVDWRARKGGQFAAEAVPEAPGRVCLVAVPEGEKVKFTGMTQNSQVDPAV